MNRRFYELAKLGAASTLACVGACAVASPYVYWGSSSTKVFDGYQVDFSPQVDSGPASNVYWASQYWMKDGSVGYFGMQTPRKGGKGTILWSVWSAIEFVADGSPGTQCYPFNEFGDGRKCDVRIDWKAGNTYRFNLQYLGDNWYRNTVTEVETGRAINLGRLKVKQPGITSGVNWTEYFDWNNRQFNWDGAPNGSMRWSNLTISTGEVLPLAPNAQDAGEKFTLSADKRTLTMETFTGRSQQLPLINRATHQCLGLVSGALKSVTCPTSLDPNPPNRDQTWTLTNATQGGTTQIHAYNACLLADPVGVSVYAASPCDTKAAAPSIESSWINRLASDGTLRPAGGTSKCLTADAVGMRVLPCTGDANQKWAQTDDFTKAYWSLSDSSTKAGGYLTFKVQLSRPTNKISWTKIELDRSQAPAAAAFWNNRQQVSWDGVNWGVPVVYYGQYVQLPIGATELYVRVATSKLPAGAKPQQARLKIQEMAGGDFKAMPEPWDAVGTITP